MVLVSLLSSRGIPPLLLNKVRIFTFSLLYKGLIYNDLLGLYDILTTHTKLLDKLCNLLVLMNRPEKKYNHKYYKICK